jgi:hypothetical protein
MTGDEIAANGFKHEDVSALSLAWISHSPPLWRV